MKQKSPLLWGLLLFTNAGTAAVVLALDTGSAPAPAVPSAHPDELAAALQTIRDLRDALQERDSRLVSLSGPSGERSPLQGPELTIENYPGTDIKKAEGRIFRGDRDGLWSEWYPSGKKKSEGNYHLGEQWGTWREWDEEGSLAKGLYVNGKKDGAWELFGQEQDKRITEVIYSEGRVVTTRWK